jgi:hypothetical protein
MYHETEAELTLLYLPSRALSMTLLFMSVYDIDTLYITRFRHRTDLPHPSPTRRLAPFLLSLQPYSWKSAVSLLIS